MLSYTTVGTNNMPEAIRFYSAIFEVLDQLPRPGWTNEWVSWGSQLKDGYAFCVCAPFDGAASTVGNGTMLAFIASSEEQVRAFHAAGLRNGGSDEGAPGTRQAYGPDFYVAYLRDPDGNKLACAFDRA
ncbi:VOC family protein [Ketogulonicigenium vulgare]|uniref:VOC family protein n=1 Tax=Ketogulonicigenium vulgare TaxID=92945 RepID=UPI002358D66B|nr:VOC family protein [Ketogulonicigenium vulgare]